MKNCKEEPVWTNLLERYYRLGDRMSQCRDRFQLIEPISIKVDGIVSSLFITKDDGKRIELWGCPGVACGDGKLTISLERIHTSDILDVKEGEVSFHFEVLFGDEQRKTSPLFSILACPEEVISPHITLPKEKRKGVHNGKHARRREKGGKKVVLKRKRTPNVRNTIEVIYPDQRDEKQSYVDWEGYMIPSWIEEELHSPIFFHLSRKYWLLPLDDGKINQEKIRLIQAGSNPLPLPVNTTLSLSSGVLLERHVDYFISGNDIYITSIRAATLRVGDFQHRVTDVLSIHLNEEIVQREVITYFFCRKVKREQSILDIPLHVAPQIPFP